MLLLWNKGSNTTVLEELTDLSSTGNELVLVFATPLPLPYALRAAAVELYLK